MKEEQRMNFGVVLALLMVSPYITLLFIGLIDYFLDLKV